MPSKLPPNVCHDIKQLLFETDKSIPAIALETGVNRRTIERMRLSYKLFDAPYPPPKSRRGRPRVFTAAQEQYLFDCLTNKADMYLYELAAAIKAQFGIEMSEPTVYNYLARCGWNRKVLTDRSVQSSGVPRSNLPSRNSEWRCEPNMPTPAKRIRRQRLGDTT